MLPHNGARSFKSLKEDAFFFMEVSAKIIWEFTLKLFEESATHWELSEWRSWHEALQSWCTRWGSLHFRKCSPLHWRWPVGCISSCQLFQDGPEGSQSRRCKNLLHVHSQRTRYCPVGDASWNKSKFQIQFKCILVFKQLQFLNDFFCVYLL